MNDSLTNNRLFYDGRTAMLGLKIFAYTPFIITGLIAESKPNNMFIEYGALGICAFAVWMLFKQLSDIRAAHAVERQTFMDSLAKQNNESRQATMNLNESHKMERVELVSSLRELNAKVTVMMESNIKATNTLATVLHDRPCLTKDSRIQESN
jgi:hypothetical protein